MFINLFIVAVYMDPILQTPAVADFQEICACISKFELDDRELKREEFCAASSPIFLNTLDLNKYKRFHFQFKKN